MVERTQIEIHMNINIDKRRLQEQRLRYVLTFCWAEVYV